MNEARLHEAPAPAFLEGVLRDNALYQDRLYFLTEMGSLLGQPTRGSCW